MIRSKVLGIGSYVPERVVTNDELRYLNHRHERQAEPVTDTNDEWIFQRSGIRSRRYVPNDGTVGSSDLGVLAAQAAIADAGINANEIDCIIFGTLSPDIHFPGNGVFLQKKLGINGNNCACFDIRQQCSAFIYGLQMADAFIRAGVYKRVLWVGAEVHSHAMDYSTRGRDVMVLFGDGASAMVLGPQETDDAKAGVMYTAAYADGSGAMDLHHKIFEIKNAPYMTLDTSNREQNSLIYPQMDGKRVFLNAVRGMVMSTQKALEVTGMTWDQINWFVPHQANLRINEKVAEVAKIPTDKVLNTIEWYGNTTAATVPLTIDYWRKQGKVKKGDRVLSAVFGAGFTWGAAIFEV
ncbi:MAG TPA: beta-ketoacyl-ACP synthase 3 [Kofleriaceae bacterium]|mgnify:CR=1 FL=1|nr:beta-ketoacyl-ACP synthase 3 [Kofleriaceae bacterium]